jgi:Ca2+-transporting ATPase
MTRPPRRKNAPVLTRALLQRVLLSASVIMLGTLSTYIHALSANWYAEADVDAALGMGMGMGLGMGLDADDGSAAAVAAAMGSSAGGVSKRATTLTFTCFVLFDMFNALTCRSAAKSVLRGEVPLRANRMFNLAVAGSLAGQAAVVHIPFLQHIFQTEALALADWLRLVALASCVLWVDEARKWWARRGGGGPRGWGYSSNV